MSVEQFQSIFLVIGPLIGVIVGGLITTVAKVIEIHYTKKRELGKQRLEKIESVYLYTNSIFSKSNRLFHYLAEPGRDFTTPETLIKFNQYLDEISEFNSKAHAAHNFYTLPKRARSGIISALP